MISIKSSRHSGHLLLYHMVWIPTHRRHILVGQTAERLKQVIQQTAAERKWDVISLETMPDHVHLVAASPPTVRPADLVKIFKGVSARILLKEFPDLAQRAGRGVLWAPSYFIASAGNVSAEMIQRYIEEQPSSSGCVPLPDIR